MAGKYKMKPNKSVLSRFKVSKTGKVKRHHALTSHLRSTRSSKTKRRLRRGAVMAEGMARRMRLAMGVSKKRPGQIAHERKIRARKLQQAAGGVAVAEAPKA